MVTKVEYVKTDESVWNLKKELESGRLYWHYYDEARFVQVDDSTTLKTLNTCELFIKTEKEIPWYDRLDDFSYPLAMTYIFSNSNNEIDIRTFTKGELGGYPTKESMRPATKAELQILMDNAPE